MSITNGYATLVELKLRLAIPSATSTYDTPLETSIEAASRRIDDDCTRRFYDTGATRHYTSDDHLTLFIPDDVLSITTLSTLSSEASGTRTYGFTWASTDYDLEPYSGPPYTRLSRTPTGNYWLPVERRGVRIVGSFGYCVSASHPRQINEACLVMAARLFERAKSPLGILGGEGISEMVRATRTDPDYEALIAGFRRQDLMVVPRW